MHKGFHFELTKTIDSTEELQYNETEVNKITKRRKSLNKTIVLWPRFQWCAGLQSLSIQQVLQNFTNISKTIQKALNVAQKFPVHHILTSKLSQITVKTKRNISTGCILNQAAL